MRKSTVVWGAALLLVLPLAVVFADVNLEGVTCPLSGKPAKADKTAEYKGKTIYFCCPNCEKAFAADPDKFATKANFQLARTGQAIQYACPVSGKPLKKGTEIDVDGVKVGFCCPNCEAKAKAADEAGKLELIFANLEKGFTLQTTCPVSGKEINPACSTEQDGHKVFFCCGKCKAAFEADPAKFAEKLK